MRSRWQYTPTNDHVAVLPAIGESVGTGAVATSIPTSIASAGAVTAIDKSNDPRWEQLLALIAKLPPDKATKLREMLGSDGLVMANSAGIGQVLQALELRRSDGEKSAAEPLMRKVCTLLEPFLINDGAEATTGTIRRKSLVPWWEASMAQSPALREIDQQYQRAVREKLTAEMERLEEEAMAELSRRAGTLAFKNTAQTVIQDVRSIGTVLAGGNALAKALMEIGIDGPPSRPGIALDELIVRRFGKAYEALGAERTFDPVWLGHAVMNHLNKPWEVVTLIHRVTGSTDVKMLEQTELAPLMDRIMDQLVAVATQATNGITDAARRKTAPEIDAANASANLYFDLAEAIAREIKLERTSAWGQAYLTSRKTLSDLIPDKLENFEETILDFLDDWTPEDYGREDHPAYLSAVAAADFLGAMKQRATRHGFGMPFTSLERRLQDTLGRSMKRPRGNEADPWPGQKRRLLKALRLI
ncbi:MAG: hypothetical protein JWO51_1091 [Rhodospirillales bacterium]|nr:hypothetical protein [Rhodospirillales bacterium]